MKRPFLYPAALLSVGILLAHTLRIPLIYPFISCIFTLALSICYAKNKILSHTALYIAIFFLGIICYGAYDILPPDHISNFTSDGEKNVFLKGVIIYDPVLSTTFYKSDRKSFLLKANLLKEDSAWRKVSGLVKVTPILLPDQA